MSAPSVLAVIPARGGSKGVPRKNVRPLGGVPLVVHALRAAAGSARLARTVVSTDDAEIADIARAAGGDVPFMRPPEFARDDTPMLDVVQHALDVLDPEGSLYDLLVLLQPTTPLRTAGDIDAALDLLVSTGADSVVSVVPMGLHPFVGYFALPEGRLEPLFDVPEGTRRQEFPRAVARNGAVYVLRAELVRAGSFYGTDVRAYEMPRARSVNIDEPDDWALAEYLVSQGPADGGGAQLSGGNGGSTSPAPSG